MPRPCPFLECRYNLVRERARAQDRWVGDGPRGRRRKLYVIQSCALDVADQGGATLEEVSQSMGVTRERVRQIEEMALRKIAARSRFLEPLTRASIEAVLLGEMR